MNEQPESKIEKLGFFERRRRAALRAGVARGMDPAVAAMRARLHHAAKSDGPIVFGPWLSEVGYEILYWIPFLHWAVKEYEIEPERVCVISRGGVSAWYGRLAKRYEDIFKLMSPAEFKALNDARYVQTGVQKHMVVSDFDRLVLEKLGYSDGILVHPEIMYNLFNGYWSGADAFARYTDHIIYRMMKPPAHPVSKKLPESFVAVKFYSRPSLVMDEDSRRIIDDYTFALAEAGPVVVLDTGLAADDHGDFAPPSHPNIISAREWMSPEDNLAAQSAIVARAREVHCTYGGFAYLPLLYGVPAESYYSIDKHFMKIHGRAAYWLSAKTKTALSVTHLSSAARLAETARRLRSERRENALAAARAGQIEDSLKEQNASLLDQRTTLASKLQSERDRSASIERELGAAHRERNDLRDAQRTADEKVKAAVQKLDHERIKIETLTHKLHKERDEWRNAQRTADEKVKAAAQKLDHERIKIETLTHNLQKTVTERDDILSERRAADEKIAAMRLEIAALGRPRPPTLASLAQSWAEAAAPFKECASVAAPALRHVGEWRLLAESAERAKSLLANIEVSEDDVEALRADLRAAIAALAVYPDDEFFWRCAALAALTLARALRGQSGASPVATLVSAAALSGEAPAAQRGLIEDLLRSGEAEAASDLCYSALIWRRDAAFHAACAEALAMQGFAAGALLHLCAGIAAEPAESVLKNSSAARVLSAAAQGGASGDEFLDAFDEAMAHLGASDRLTPAYVKAVSHSEAGALTRKMLHHARREPDQIAYGSANLNLPLVLISQVQRSGGTLLAQLLDHHPNLLTHPHELHIGHPNKWDWPRLNMKDAPEAWLEILFERTIAKFLAKASYTKSDGNSFALEEKKPFPFSLPALVHEFDRRARDAKTPRDCINAYLAAYFHAWRVAQPAGEKKWYVGFCPRMLLHDESISGFFSDYPDGRLIACIRDPYSWYASSMRHDAEYADIDHAMDLWRASAEAAFRQFEAHPDATFLMTYDALVENPLDTMTSVADFLGVAATQSMLQPTYAGEPILPNSSYDINQYGIHRMSLDAGDRLTDAQRSHIGRAAAALYERAVEITGKSGDRAVRRRHQEGQPASAL